MSKKYKVIFHVDSKENWQMVINNVTNLLEDFKENKNQLAIEVLANASAVEFYEQIKENEANEDQLSKLTKEGVHFTACSNSLNKKDISPEDLYSMIEVVPAGVSELVKRQTEGFAYIKP